MFVDGVDPGTRLLLALRGNKALAIPANLVLVEAVNQMHLRSAGDHPHICNAPPFIALGTIYSLFASNVLFN